MKVEIYESTKKPEQTLRLKFEEAHNGVNVVATDEDGLRVSAGCLLTFSTDGRIILHTSVSPWLGLQLDSYGRIITNKERL